jgi:hypothetical protein
VRDYQGKTEVNAAIQRSLADIGMGEQFWWLNNGITVLCDEISVVNMTATVESPQIVNGLQTSNEIFEHFSNTPIPDDREVLVRFVKPLNSDSANRIIRATNSQTTIPVASLHATDVIHRNIEEYLLSKGLYYERRKNHYKNQGRSKDKIVSISWLAQAVMAIILRRPDDSRARPSSLLKSPAEYDLIFSENYPIETYLKCTLILQQVEQFLKGEPHRLTAGERNNLKFHVAMFLAGSMLNTDKVTAHKLSTGDFSSISPQVLDESLSSVRILLNNVVTTRQISEDQASKSREFVSDVFVELKVRAARHFIQVGSEVHKY